jgi:diaminopimelate epimerase
LRAYFFDAAGNNVVIGLLQSTGISPAEGFQILHRAECTPLAEKEPDVYGVLYRDGGQLRVEFSNPDGSREELCGNALRCVPLVMAHIGQPAERVVVQTGLGPVECVQLGPGIYGAEIPTAGFSITDAGEGDVLVHVGTPHRVRFVEDLAAVQLLDLGRSWAQAAIPVAATFVRPHNGVLHVRSVERGVVRETGSSGTAAIAAYLAYDRLEGEAHRDFREARFPCGRRLKVRFDDAAHRIVLYGACRLEFACDLVTDGEHACSA